MKIVEGFKTQGAKMIEKTDVYEKLDEKIETCKESRSNYLRKGKLKEARYQNETIKICGELKYLIEGIPETGIKKDLKPGEIDYAAKSEPDDKLITLIVRLALSIDAVRKKINSSEHKSDWNYACLDSALIEVKERIILQRILVGFNE